MNCELPKTYHLTGVSRGGEILLFGGASNALYITYRLSEEGEVVSDLSEMCGEIPGVMCGGVTLLAKEEVYAIGYRRENNKLEERYVIFDGEKWEEFI